MGTVALAAGSSTTLTFSGNSLLHLRVDQSVVKSAAENGGLIRADGGQVIMTAGAKNSLLASVVNNSGVIQARTMQNHDGNIVLLGGMQAGQVTVDGTLDVSSSVGGGGQILATAKGVAVGDGASVQATGATGGGTIAIGAGWEGGAGIDQATTVYVAKTATLNARATGNGNGGTISVRSDVDNPNSTARIYGKLLAQAAAHGGNGGRIETSGHWLDVDGSAIDASAARGRAGEWLLDPWNVIIGATGAAVAANPYVPTADSTITASSINTALNLGNSVTISTGTSGTTSLGDITVNAPISKTSGGASVLVLQAADSIIINQPITNTSPAGRLDLNLYADNQNGVHDGVGVVILNNSITTNGGYIKFGDGSTMTVNGVANTEVGGDAYVGGSSAISLSTAGGLIAVHGQMIIANTSGLTLSSANGNINFDGLVDSGDAYAFVTTTGTWSAARSAAQSGLGANVGDTYLATITSRLENSVAGATAGYVASWLGGRRVTTINAANDPIWRWVTGPEGAANGGTGTPFFTQNGSDTTQGSGGTAISGAYTNWNTGEPNNSGGTNLSPGGTGEQVMQFVGTQGQWNDLSLTATTLGYVKETNLAPSALTVNGGTGTVTFSKAIGSNKPVALLSVTGATIALPNPAVVQTTGTQTFVGQVTVGGTNVNLLTVSGNNVNTTYGGGVPALTPTYSGFVNGDTAASLTTAANVTTSAGVQPNVGSYVTTPSGAVDPNYFILYNPGTLIVNPATLTVTANNTSKTYNQTNPALTVGYAGFMYSDTTASLVTAATVSTTAVMASNVGAYPITPAGAVPSANYTAAYVNGTLTVNPITLTVSGLTGTGRAYNGSLLDALSGAGTLTGLVAGQTLTLANTNGTLGNANAGGETVTTALTLVNGTGLAANYVLTQPTLANVTITPAPLTVSGLSGTGRAYNASTVDALAGTGVLSGLVSGETLTLGGAANGTLGSANAGSETVTTALTLVNGSGLAANYVLTQPTLANVTITPAPLTLSGLLGTDRPYNGNTIDALTGTATLTGLVGGETLSLVDASNGTLASANAGSEALTTAIALGNGTGQASNYLLTQAALPNVTIAQATLTVSGTTVANKVYDGTRTATLTGTLSGLFGTDVVTLLPAGSFGSKDVGTSIVVTAADTLGGAAAPNYTLTQPTGLAANITPLAITVSAAGVNKVYDGGLNAAATLSSAGVIAGDTVTFSDNSALFEDKNVGSGKTVAVSGISASGPQSVDYAVSNTTASTTASITQLGSVAWIGPATGGSWSNPANWAGGAIPDLSNVANVAIPIGDNVIFDAAVAGPVKLNQLGSGGLTVNSGTLNIASALNLTNFAQSGGTVGGAGSFSVTNSFSQSSGQIAMGEGPISINQASGSLSFASITGGSVNLNSELGAVMLGNLMASGNLAVTAAGGGITQSPGTTLTVGGSTGLAASVAGAPADINLDNAGNLLAQAVSASGLQVSLVVAGPLILGAVDASADLILNASGGLDLGSSTVGGNLLADSANGNVTQHGPLSVAGTTDITAGTGNVQLINAGNRLVRTVTMTGQQVTLTNAAPLLLGTVVTGGNLNVDSSGALDLGHSTVGANLVANSGNGNVTQDGPLSVGGTTDIVAGTGTISLNNPGNVFQGFVTTSGSNVAIGKQQGAVTLQASIDSAVSQLQSGVLWSEPGNPPDALNLSSTVNETRDGERVQVTMNIGAGGPQLHILNGGMRLPDNSVGPVRDRN